MVEWFHFGLILGVPDHELTMIKIDNPNVSLCKMQMLRTWIRMKRGSWSDVVEALPQKIAKNYGMYTSMFAHFTVMPIYPIFLRCQYATSQ